MKTRDNLYAIFIVHQTSRTFSKFSVQKTLLFPKINLEKVFFLNIIHFISVILTNNLVFDSYIAVNWQFTWMLSYLRLNNWVVDCLIYFPANCNIDWWTHVWFYGIKSFNFSFHINFFSVGFQSYFLIWICLCTV